MALCTPACMLLDLLNWVDMVFPLAKYVSRMLGKPSNEKKGNNLVFYQTRGGGSTPKPNKFRSFLGDFLLI